MTTDNDAASKLPKIEGVKAVSKARMVYTAAAQPNDPDFSKQWYHSSIGTLGAWDANQGAQSMVIAVCDTGVDYNHEDVKNSMCTGGVNSANGNKYGYSAFGSEPIGNHGHGTHVSGIIAATVNNALGGAGIAPNVKIMAIKILKDDATGLNQYI